MPNYGEIPNPQKKGAIFIRTRNIKLNIFLNEDEKQMLIIKCKQAKLSQSDFVRNIINQYFDSQPTKIEIEDIKISLTKIIDNLSLLKSQMDFFNFSDYSIFITKQISNIRDIINQFQK